MKQHLLGNLILYRTEEGGRASPMRSGLTCPAFVTKSKDVPGWTCRTTFEKDLLKPGETTGAKFSFLYPAGLEMMEKAERFYLWDGKFFGEAVIFRE